MANRGLFDGNLIGLVLQREKSHTHTPVLLDRNYSNYNFPEDETFIFYDASAV